MEEENKKETKTPFKFSNAEDILNYLYAFCGLNGDIDPKKLIKDLEDIENGKFPEFVKCNLCECVIDNRKKYIGDYFDKYYKCSKCAKYVCVNCRERCGYCKEKTFACFPYGLSHLHTIKCHYPCEIEED